MMRTDGRTEKQLRKTVILKDYTIHAEGSVLYCQGNTKVICTATVEEGVPPYLAGTGKGWITAEYSMLPRATETRNKRDISKLKQAPRSTEIQRLIGRALRGAVDLSRLGERTIIIDCDVIQADGGTRCASINGGFTALSLAVRRLLKEGVLAEDPIRKQVAAVSVGILDGVPLLDLCYQEDSRADTDMNVVMSSEGGFIEIQGTAEGKAFDKKQLDTLLSLARGGCLKIFKAQNKVLNG